MALYCKWDVINGFAYVLQFFSDISDGLGDVLRDCWQVKTRIFNLAKNQVLVFWGGLYY